MLDEPEGINISGDSGKELDIIKEEDEYSETDSLASSTIGSRKDDDEPLLEAISKDGIAKVRISDNIERTIDLSPDETVTIELTPTLKANDDMMEQPKALAHASLLTPSRSASSSGGPTKNDLPLTPNGDIDLDDNTVDVPLSPDLLDEITSTPVRSNETGKSFEKVPAVEIR